MILCLGNHLKKDEVVSVYIENMDLITTRFDTEMSYLIITAKRKQVFDHRVEK